MTGRTAAQARPEYDESMRKRFAIFTLLGLFWSLPARALRPVLDWTLSGAGFAAGAETSIIPGVRQPLWDRPDNAILQSTYLQANALFQVTPAFSRAGVELAFQPAAIFELRLQYSAAAYYGVFSAIIPFDTPDDATNPDARASRERTWGWGNRVSIQPTVRAKAGPVAVMAWTVIRWGDVHPHGMDGLQYWFEPELTLLVARQSWTLDSNALVAGELPVDGPTIYVGIYGTDRQALSTHDRIDRVGPAVMYTTANQHWTMYGIVQAYIESRIFERPLPPYMAARLQYSL